MVPFLGLELRQIAICFVKNTLGMLMYHLVHSAASRIFALQLIDLAQFSRLCRSGATFLSLCCFFNPSLYAWNALGHELVAEIAFTQLSPETLERLALQSSALKMGYQPKRLRQAAVWLDWLRCKEASCQNYRHYHYIDYPFAPDGTKSMPPRAVNAVTAVDHALHVLHSRGYLESEKGLQLRILMHVVADLHQPMHAVSLYSKDFPEGDAGGNRFALGSNRVANNLHAYWDRGAGFLVKHARRKPGAVKQQAKRILKHYPCNIQDMDLHPTVWAAESYQLAIKQAYQLRPHAKPSRAYQSQARKITEQRLALAGCRLAALLAVPQV